MEGTRFTNYDYGLKIIIGKVCFRRVECIWYGKYGKKMQFILKRSPLLTKKKKTDKKLCIIQIKNDGQFFL